MILGIVSLCIAAAFVVWLLAHTEDELERRDR